MKLWIGIKMVDMINNEDNKYIVLRKDIYSKFGFVSGMIVQLLVDGDGEFIGSTGTMHDIISVVSLTSVKNHLKELEYGGVIITEKVGGWCNRYKLVDKSFIHGMVYKRKIPIEVKEIVEKIKKIRRNNEEI